MNSLNPVLRVRNSIAHALRDHGQALPGAAMLVRVTDLLAQLGLPAEVANRFPHELSGRMKQRVCIAIAISLGPRVIIADEPTSALDVITQRQVMRTMHAAQDRLGSAMILIGHDMGLMAQSVDTIGMMRAGNIVEMADVNRMFSRPSHPYTVDLINSVPVVGGDVSRRVALSPDATAPLMAFHEVSKLYPGKHGKGDVIALHPISFSLPADQPRIISIVGQSGSGKTTLGALVLGFTAPSAGTIKWEGRSVATLPGRERRVFRRNVQAVLQDPYTPLT